MKILQSFVLAVIVYIFIGSSCECPTDLITKRIVEPTIYSNVVFIHALPDINEIKLSVWARVISNNLKYDDSLYSYKKIGVGDATIKISIANDSIMIYHAVMNLDSRCNYTFVTYGADNRVHALLAQDTINSYSKYNVYIRGIHVSPDAPPVSILIEDAAPVKQIDLEYNNYSPIHTIHSGKFNIIVNKFNTTQNLYSISDYNFKPGKIYNLILKGYNSGSHTNKLQLQIVELDYPIHID